jgi:hypothetical protein
LGFHRRKFFSALGTFLNLPCSPDRPRAGLAGPCHYGGGYGGSACVSEASPAREKGRCLRVPGARRLPAAPWRASWCWPGFAHRRRSCRLPSSGRAKRRWTNCSKCRRRRRTMTGCTARWKRCSRTRTGSSSISSSSTASCLAPPSISCCTISPPPQPPIGTTT